VQYSASHNGASVQKMWGQTKSLSVSTDTDFDSYYTVASEIGKVLLEILLSLLLRLLTTANTVSVSLFYRSFKV
jgi:hypothetical protein